MDKNIGILTFHTSGNYGALLQTLGTYTTVKKLGYKPNIINYHSPNKEGMYQVMSVSKNKSFRENMRAMINTPFKAKRKKSSNEFREKILKVAPQKLSTYDDLKVEQEKYAKIIVGSDQVWNYQNTGFDKRYLLDFVEDSNKKVSYAASFALSEIEEKYKNEYATLLKTIPFLSVREERGCELVEELIGTPAVQTLDPTLLLKKEEWTEFATSERLIKERYLLVYSIGNEKKTLEQAKKIAKKLDLKVVAVGKRFNEHLMPGVKALNPSPTEFVGLFKESSYVVTSSFHGLVFSIIFNKKFTCTLDKKRPGNSRQLSLLDMAGLSSRLAFDSRALSKIDEKINWFSVNEKVEKQRQKSLEFLKSALEK